MSLVLVPAVLLVACKGFVVMKSSSGGGPGGAPGGGAPGATSEKAEVQLPPWEESSVKSFLDLPVPADEKAANNYLAYFSGAELTCGNHRDAISDECYQRVHTQVAEEWAAYVESILADATADDAYHGALLLLAWQLEKSWRGPTAPLELVRKAAALKVAHKQKAFAASKSYAPRNKYDCVASSHKLPGRGSKLKLEYVVTPKADVYVRCYVSIGVGEWARGKEQAKLYGRVVVRSAAGASQQYAVPIALGKWGGKDYFDFDFSLADWGGGAALGTVEISGRLSFILNHESVDEFLPFTIAFME